MDQQCAIYLMLILHKNIMVLNLFMIRFRELMPICFFVKYNINSFCIININIFVIIYILNE